VPKKITWANQYSQETTLKRNLNELKKVNARLRARIQQLEEDCANKDKFLQDMIAQSRSESPEEQRAETPFATYLKQKVSELEAEKDWWKKECLQMRKQAYNKYWSMPKDTGEENKKTASGNKSTSQSKKQTHAELQEQVLDQKVLIKELNERIRELTIELEKVKDSESQALDELNKARIRGMQVKKKKQKLRQQEKTIEKARERINVLEIEKKALQEKLEEANENVNRETPDKVFTENLEQLKTKIKKLKKEKNDQSIKIKQISKSLLDKEREIREITSSAKENEDKYILERLEEKERLEARIVRLELQLSALVKEQPEETSKPKPLTEIDTAVRRVIKPLVQEADLFYPKQLFKVVMIKEKKGLDQIKKELFAEYEPDERISVKELVKVLKREPLKLNAKMAEDLARYLIEPRDTLEVVYNVYEDKLVGDIRILIDNLVAVDYPANFWESEERIIEDALKKLKGKISTIETDDLNFVKWAQICKEQFPELSSMEKDFTIALMVDNNNLYELNFDVDILLT
jgi:chromosome segregation ATPase